MPLMSLSVILFWALCAAGIAWYAAEVAKDVTYVTLADGRRQERSLPVVFKMLLPFVGNLDGVVSRPMFRNQIETADWMLVAAGFEGLLSGRRVCGDYYFLRILFFQSFDKFFEFDVSGSYSDHRGNCPMKNMIKTFVFAGFFVCCQITRIFNHHYCFSVTALVRTDTAKRRIRQCKAFFAVMRIFFCTRNSLRKSGYPFFRKAHNVICHSLCRFVADSRKFFQFFD